MKMQLDYLVVLLIFIINFTFLQAASNLMTQLFVGNYFRGYSGENISATSSLLLKPMSGWSDSIGNFYIADDTRIRKIDQSGTMNTVCGTGINGFTADGAPANATMVSYVTSVWGDSLGNLFYIDGNNQLLRKIDAMTSNVTTMVGGTFSGDNLPGTSTTLNSYFMTGDTAGNLYYSDYNNYRVRKFVKSTGKVLTIAGNGGTSYAGELVIATSSSINDPTGLAVDTSGNVFFIERSGQRIRQVEKTGIMRTIVGTGSECYNRDGLPGTSTDLCYPRSLFIDSLGNLFWVETSSNRLRKYTPTTGLVSTLIGNYGGGYAGDGLNIISNPSQILINAQDVWGNSRGDLFIADTDNYRVRSIVNQIINTVAGNGYLSYGGDGGPATSASINNPGSVWGDTLGTVYFVDVDNYHIRAISAAGIITTLGGTGENGPFTADDSAAFTSMSLSNLQALSGDSNGNIYFFDAHQLRRYVISSSSVQTLAGDLGISGSYTYFDDPKAIWVNTMGDVYIVEQNNQRVRLFNQAEGIVLDFAGDGFANFSGDDVPATGTSLSHPSTVWGDTAGNVFISDSSNYRIRRVFNGIMTTFAGNGGGDFSSDGVSATSVPIGYPSSVSGDSLGNVYFSDASYCRVRVVTSSGPDYSNAIINTIVGTYGWCSSIYTPSLQIATEPITKVQGLWIDSIGSIYMVERESNFIRKAFYITAPTSQPSAQPSTQPSKQPTTQPSSQPSRQPTTQPSSQPSRQPTTQPSSQPSRQPTTQPSSQPSRQPTTQPSTQPSRQPTTQPSSQPSMKIMSPTSQPTAQPTKVPTTEPSNRPTTNPTMRPTTLPSSRPSALPTPPPTTIPTNLPSSLPSSKPSMPPVSSPTSNPTSRPLSQPTTQPTSQPTTPPSKQPISSRPTALPTPPPIRIPTTLPTSRPSSQPSQHLTGKPTSSQPSLQPSPLPSSLPSSLPSQKPSSMLSTRPTTPHPTSIPSSRPSDEPSPSPTTEPSSSQPTSAPTAQRQPSPTPSSIPTTLPTTRPSSQPTTRLSSFLSSLPTVEPSVRPAANPSSFPSSSPSSYPTVIPSTHPKSHPTRQPTSEPSARPSSHPTYTPTTLPSLIPTLHPSHSFPRVVRVTPTVTKTSLRLSISLAADSGVLYGGIFTTPQTSSKVVAAVIRQSYSTVLKGVNHTSLFFSSLSPATSYYVYLVAVAGDGSRASTSEEVMGSAVVVTTECCRVIEVAAGTGVVAGSGKVVVAAAQPVTHFLSIRVRDKVATSPSLSLRLYAVRESNNESLSDAIRPYVIDLSSTASYDVSASLSALSAGIYYVRANLTGSNAFRYEVRYIVNTTSSSSWMGLGIRVVGSQLPAPSLVSAIFSNDGTALWVSFSSDTNQPSPMTSASTTSFFCDNVLDFPCATSSTCRWTDRRTVVATVKSADYCASPGDILRLSETVTLKAACDGSCTDYISWPSTNTTTSAVVISSSSSSGSGPRVILSLPSQLGQCSALALDVTASTGSAGRSWSKSNVHVTAASTSNTTSTDSLEALQSYVRSTSFDITRSPPPSIPPHLLSPDVIYSFNVTLCNFLQRCGQTVGSVAVVSKEVPVVKVLGASELSMTRSQSLSLTSSVALASCSSSSTSLIPPRRVSYVWTVQKMTSSSSQVTLGAPVTVTSVSRDPSRFVLPSFSLQGSSLYRILLNATTSTSTASAAVTVSVGEGKVIAVVQGGVVGGVKGVRVGGTLTLDASKSYDEDQQGALMWQWSCVQLSPSVNGSCDDIFSPLTSSLWSSSVLSIRVSEVAEGYLARLSVDVSVVSDSGKKRQGSASVRVITLPATSPTITLTSNAAFQGVQGGAIMNAGQSLLVTADVSLPASSSSFNATWSLQTSESASGVNLNAVSLTPVTQILSASSSTVKVYLSLPGNVLASGLSYSFYLLLTPSPSSSSDEVLGGSSSVVVAVNAPPQPGVFEVSPGWGREVLDAFSFACSVWTDVDLPLSYQFGYWSLSGSKMVARSMSVLSYASSILLPGGARERNYSVMVFADVFDSLSADTTVTHSLAVLPVTTSNTSSSSSVATSFVSKYLNFSSGDQGGVDSLLQVTSLGSYLLHRANCSLAPNCTSLHRLPCYATPHTCGPCVTSSMIGTSGDANDRCYNPGDLSVSPNDVLGSSLKQCVGGCSGHGQCVFLSTLTNEVVSGECYEGDVACTASCVCDVGYRSSAYGKCAEEVRGGADDLLARQIALKQVSEGVVVYASLQETSEQTVTSWIGSVGEVVGGGSGSDDVSSDTLTTLLDVVSYAMTSASSLSDVAVSLSGLPATLDKIASASLTSSLSLSRRRRLVGESNSTDIVLGQVIAETLRNYTVLVGQGMAPGQAATTVVQRNFRLHVENIDLSSPPTTSPVTCASSSSKNVSVSLPSSALEALYHTLPTSSLTLPLPPPPCNTSSTSTTTSLVMSVTSVSRDLYSNSSFLSDVTSLHLSQHPCSSEREECEVVLVLQTTNTTSHTIIPVSRSNNVTVTCVAGDHSLKEVYFANVHKSFSVQCSGKEEKVVARCPSIKVVPTCADVRGSVCRLIHYTESNVTCACTLPSPNTLSRHLLAATDNTTSSRGVGSAVVDVQYVAMLKSIEESFVTTVISASLLDASTVEDSWQVLVTLGSLVTVVIAALLFSHYADKEVCKKIEAEEKMIQHAKNTHYLSRYLQRPSNTTSHHKRGSGRHSQSMNRPRTNNADSITTLAEEALPSILSSQSVGSRVKTELRRHHRWIGVIYYFSSKFPRVYRVMSLASNIIIMLFIQSLTYAFTKQDPSTCTQYVTEESCLEPSSVYRTGENQCLWQVRNQGQGIGGDCVYVTPDNSIEVVVFVAIFSALATTPIALLVDWIINVILVAPTASDSDEVDGKMKERKYALSSFRSSFSTSFSQPRLLPVVPASEAEHKDDDVNRTSMNRKASHDEDKIRISLKAHEEFEEMRSALLHYRERALHTTDLEEFNRLWGLTEDGQFRVIHLDDGLGVGVGKTHSIERIIEREIVELHYSLEKELLRFQEVGVTASASSTSVVLRSERARTKRLLYLFQRDLIPGISGEILDNKDQRDNVTLTPVSRHKKMLAWLVLTLLDAGMLFYVFLFAVSQDSHSQSAWGQSLAVWLLLDVLIVSTSICVVMHVLLPSLVLKDVTQIKKKLQDSLKKYYNKVEAQRKAGQVFLTQSDLVNSFNAAHYLFLSYRLAETFPELKASQVILQYTTPWPRQSYQHIFDVAKNYDGKWAALTRSASTIIVFFLTSLISLPAVVQDIIVQCTVVSAFGYTLLLHIQLYSIFPVLVIVPALALFAFAHFLYTSFKKQQEVEKAKMTHFLTDSTTTSDKDNKEVEGGVKREGVLKRLNSRLKSRHQINVINTAPRQQRGGNALVQNTSSNHNRGNEVVPVVEEDDVVPALTIAEQVIHVTRRQSVQQGIHVMRRLRGMSQGKTRSGGGGSDGNYESEYDVDESEVDSQDLLHRIEEDYHYNDYDNYVTLSSYHLNDTNNNDDVVMGEEMTSEGYEVVKKEGEEVKDDDADSVDFLFNEDNQDDDDEALHLPPQSTSHDIVEDDDVSLSDLFLGNEEEEEKE